jgi:hypothetical protein
MILYKSVISNDLVESLLEIYRKTENSLKYATSSNIFPIRKYFNEIPNHLIDELMKELIITCNQYYNFTPNINNVRIYHSNYGTVKPHKDIPIYPGDTHTCLIYLTDNFYGGNLSIKEPRTIEDLELNGNLDKKHLLYTVEPRAGYGIIFDKNYIHYNDELLSGDKIILLVDFKIEK